MRALLVGAAGQLGMALSQRVPSGVELVAAGRHELDITDADSINRAMQRLRPTLVINAAAYTHVDQAESDREAAFRANADGPRFLAEAVATLGARLLHVSTDFVFSGDRPEPYDVDAETAPVNIYGESKLAGERAVIGTLGSGAVVVRTSWLYASNGRNFVRTMLELMRTRESIGVVVDQVGTPTWAGSLAEAMWDMARAPAIDGIQHWTDGGVASWYDFAVAIQEEALVRGLLSRAIPIRAIRESEYPTAARRPHYSVLDKRRTAALLGYAPVHWRQGLRSMLDELAAS